MIQTLQLNRIIDVISLSEVWRVALLVSVAKVEHWNGCRVSSAVVDARIFFSVLPPSAAVVRGSGP